MIVDWFRVICDLTRAGWSESRIAAAIHVPKSTLVGWKQGSEPRYRDGQALLDLWSKETHSFAASPPVLLPGDFRGYHTSRRLRLK